MAEMKPCPNCGSDAHAELTEEQAEIIGNIYENPDLLLMEEAKASAELEGAKTDKTICQLLDMLEKEPECSHDYDNPIRIGRANYICPECKKNISLELVFIYEATHDL